MLSQLREQLSADAVVPFLSITEFNCILGRVFESLSGRMTLEERPSKCCRNFENN